MTATAPPGAARVSDTCLLQLICKVIVISHNAKMLPYRGHPLQVRLSDAAPGICRVSAELLVEELELAVVGWQQGSIKLWEEVHREATMQTCHLPGPDLRRSACKLMHTTESGARHRKKLP
jgi:hypothetical protein